MFPLVANIPGFSSIGVSERVNQLVVGVTPSARESVLGIIRARGVPDAAVSFDVSENAIRATSGLRGTWRATFGGIQIKPDFANDEYSTCTLGFNVTDSTATRYFLTASHCTDIYDSNSQGRTGDPWYQPCCSITNRIGQVSINPPWNSTDSRCGTTVQCVEADVMAVAYDGPVQADKSVARTTCCYGMNSQPGSITVSGEWPVTATTVLAQSHYVWKLGRTTGLTQGDVSMLCVHVLVNSSPALGTVRVICATQVSGSLVQGGDSGGPEFVDTNQNSRAAAGLVFASAQDGFGNCTAPCISYYSPWAQMQVALNRTVTPY